MKSDNQKKREYHQRWIASMTGRNRRQQLEAASRSCAEAWEKLICAWENGQATPEDKRRYTLAYNGLRSKLKKMLYHVIP